jgi:hypothetical protein
MIRNRAGQVITAALINRTTGFPVDSGTVTVQVLGDGGTKTNGAGTIENEGGGTWSYFPTQAETNYAAVTFSFTHDDAVNVDVQVHPQPATSGSVSSPITVTEGVVPFGLDGPVVAQWDGVGVQVVDLSGSITATVGSTRQVAITCNQNVEAVELHFVVERMNKADVATVEDDAISRAGTVATLSLTSEMTSVERTLRWSLVSATTGEALNSGLMFVTYDAQGD